MAEDNPVLRQALSCSVPLYIAEIRGWSAQRRVEEAKRCAAEVATHGDDLLYRSKDKGGSARAFNALALGLAIGAYQPGGVEFAGQHWCVEPHPGCAGPTGIEPEFSDAPARPARRQVRPAERIDPDPDLL